jgi:carbon monoxide dehydrogenase subunit G
MSKYISKTGKINLQDEKIYTFLSDFTNLKNIIPADKVSDFSATADSCQFTVSGLGKAGLKMVEKEPFKLIKITSDGGTPFSFFFWIQLKPVDEDTNSTALRLTLEAELNPMMKMVIGNQLQNGLDKLVDYIAEYFNTKFNN